MPENNPPTPPASSAFEIVSPSKSKKTNFKSIIIILLVFVFLGGAIFLGVTLVNQNQNIAEKASKTADSCPAAEACPGEDGTLYSCTPGNPDPDASFCNPNFEGRIEPCGGGTYCCNGTVWTTDMTSCAATPTATATATASPTATPTETIEPLVTQSPTPTSTATTVATATPAAASSSSTPIPIPATGTGWPTYVGAGVGIVVIIASILLAI